MPDPAQVKRALRAQLRERRRIATATERERAADGIAQRLGALVRDRGARSIAAYLSTPNEPDTRGFLRSAHADGIRILLPISRRDGLLDWAPYDGEAEDEDTLGMPMPTTELLGPIAINDVDLIIVPAAAVDASGMRLGWGQGYFDKTLGSMAARPPVYAVVFDDEVLDELPAERHDEPVDGAVTPTRTIEFTRSA